MFLLRMVYLMSIVFTTTSGFAENKNSKVVVIGAGLAGLTAAYHLQNEGMDVELYEARKRVGGRVLTVYVNGHAAELGAHNIADGGEASHLSRLIDAFELEVTKSRVNLNQSYFDGEELIPLERLLSNKQFEPQKLKEQLNELASTSHNMKEVLSGIIDESDPLYKVMAVRLAAYEGAPIEKLSPLYTETLFHMLLGGLCSVHQGNEEGNHVDLISIKGGNARLAEKIAETLGPRLHLDMALSAVTKNADGSFVLTFRNGQRIETDILVLAIPCSVYEKILFGENIIPKERLEAIKNVQYGENAKILVPFHTVPSRKTGAINDQIVSYFDSAQNTLTIYYTGMASLFSDKTIVNAYLQARPLIEMGFNDACPSFVPPIVAEDRSFVTYETPVGYSWPNDPYAKGSYSYIAPGQETLLTTITEEKGEKFKTLFAPIHNLYFAGEHASVLLETPGTMEAACESGERIARTIVKNR